MQLITQKLLNRNLIKILENKIIIFFANLQRLLTIFLYL